MNGKSELRKKLDKTRIYHLATHLQVIKYSAHGDTLVEINECSDEFTDALISSGFCENNKVPDSILDCGASIDEIIRWCISCFTPACQHIYHLIINEFWIPFSFFDIESGFSSLWQIIFKNYNSITIFDPDSGIVYDFSNDSRDEQHFLFDEYHL